MKINVSPYLVYETLPNNLNNDKNWFFCGMKWLELRNLLYDLFKIFNIVHNFTQSDLLLQ